MDRIRELREESGMKMSHVAKKLGIPYTTYVNYEKGTREPNSEMLIDIANLFNVSIDYLLGRSNQRIDDSVLDAALSVDIDLLEQRGNIYDAQISQHLRDKMREYGKGVKIPVLGTVAAGIPINAFENVIDYEEIPEEMAKTGEFFALKIKGKSMEPRILNGDVVIIRKQPDVDSGEIAVVLINGDEATVKSVKKNKSGIMLTAYNSSAWEPRFYDNDDIKKLPVKILGKVVELRGKF